MNFLKYFFTPAPGATIKFYLPISILAAILILGSIAFSILYKKRKKEDFAFKRLFKKTSGRARAFGILFIVLIAVRYENIPYFSMRIWMYLLLLILAYFVYKYIKIYKVDYPREKENVKFKQQKKSGKKENRYLPDKKKKR
ncbi:hypothetical protein GF366_04990 [Candidatus Peregrinibacteria bacterium]|nr:hypothetical protein [Candidatus Peregrinibacteria bacterium]